MKEGGRGDIPGSSTAAHSCSGLGGFDGDDVARSMRHWGSITGLGWGKGRGALAGGRGIEERIRGGSLS